MPAPNPGLAQFRPCRRRREMETGRATSPWPIPCVGPLAEALTVRTRDPVCGLDVGAMSPLAQAKGHHGGRGGAARRRGRVSLALCHAGLPRRILTLPRLLVVDAAQAGDLIQHDVAAVSQCSCSSNSACEASKTRGVYRSIATYFVARYSSIPSGPPSRPNPDCFMPPNGAEAFDTMPRLRPTIPNSRPSTTRNARFKSRV
jgi:hypothetical protein